MVKVLPAIFSYENMKSKWNQDNPDNPYSRRDELQQGIYSLDKWLIRVDDNNKTIATKEYLQWSGLQITNPGDTIEVLGSSTGLTITISGAEAV